MLDVATDPVLVKSFDRPLLVELKERHLRGLRVQGAQKEYEYMLEQSDAVAVYMHGPGWSAVSDGRVIGCAGVALQWFGRAVVWSFIDERITPREFIRCHHLTKAKIAQLQLSPRYKRLEMDVDQDFRNGHRWARALGFRDEGPMEAYSPTGRTCHRYARVA